MALVSYLLLATASLLLPLVQTKCYFPDGISSATQDVPCHKNGNSTCCGPGYACLSNNICKWTSNVLGTRPTTDYIRGSCTDSTWSDGNCPLFCANEAIGDNQSGGIGMGKCSDTAFYCLDSAQSDINCAKTSGPLVLFSSSATTVTIVGVSSAAATTSSSVSATSSTTSSTSSATSTPSISASAISTTSTTSSVPTTSSTSTMSTAATPISSPSPSSNLGLAVGAGVGIPLGIIAISLASWLLFRARRTQKRDQALSNETSEYYSGPGFGVGHNQAEKQQAYLDHQSVVAEMGEGCQVHELPERRM